MNGVAINFELLHQGDNDEIRRAIRSLGLVEVACAAVNRRIGGDYPGDVRPVAIRSITDFFRIDIQQCRTDEEIKQRLRLVAYRNALDFLDEAFRRHCRVQLDDGDLQLIDERPGEQYKFLKDVLSEGLGLEAFELSQVTLVLCEICALNETEECLLVEHVVGGMTQQAFAQRYGLAFRGIGGRVDRLLRKIRRCLSRRSEWIREILRRNL